MITTFTGPMHSGKTSKLIDVYNSIFNKSHILTFKPNKDTRDIGYITSKDYEEGIPCVGIDRFEEIENYINNSSEEIRTIFIDEVQLMEGDINTLIKLSIIDDIDIYLAGLNMTSEQEPFLVMPYILAISDNIEIIKASCYDCGREAEYTYYDGIKEDSILVGDSGYFPLCSRCLKKRRESKVKKKVK